MSEEMKMLLKLTEEVAEYRTFFNMLATKVEQNDLKNKYFMDVEEIKPLMDAFNKGNKELQIIPIEGGVDYVQK